MQLINGDCFVEMKKMIKKNIKVDCILTDPPYGMSFQSGRRKEKHKIIKNDNNLEWLDEFIEDCYVLSNDNTAHYFFCSFHNIDIFKQKIEKKFVVKNILVWEKNIHGSGDLYYDFAPKTEFIIFAQKGKRKINGKRTENIFKFSKTGNELHPTQKPVDLIEHLIEKFTSEGDIILDPFMGSGTTGVAAIKNKRDFIGIELDAEYFKISEKRIKETKEKIANSLDDW